jgi:hypothetical protein
MSGKLQIAITGLQNQFISGNPTFSHFLSNFKKHTKFAFNTIESPLVNAKFDEETMCIIPIDSGDLINTFTLRYKLFYKASISSEHFTGSVGHNGYGAYGERYDDPFTANVGIHAIDYAELYIGGTLIEKLTSDWIYLYHKYNTASYVFTNSILYQTQAAKIPYGSTPKVIGTNNTFVTTNGFQQVANLQATGGNSSDDFGEDEQVALDGDTVVVGADYDNAVYVFTRDTPGDAASGWTQSVRLSNTGNGESSSPGFGSSVSIDGDTLIVGMSKQKISGSFFVGSVCVYTRDTPGNINSSWTLRHTIDGNTSLNRPYFGASVSLEGDTLAVGTWRSNYVYIYTRTTPGTLNSTWTLRATLSLAYNTGFRVSLSGDRVAIGGDGANRVYVYKRDTLGDLTSGWSQEYSVSGAFGDFGRSVSLSGDTLLVGARRGRYVLSTDTYFYEAFVYTRRVHVSGGPIEWMLTTTLTPGDGAMSNFFGDSVSIKNDIIVIGATASYGADGIYIYRRDTPGDLTSGWSYEIKFTPSGSGKGDSVYTDGNTVIAGNKSRNVYVFENTTTTTLDTSDIVEHIWNLKQMYIDLPFYFYNNLPASILACKLNKQNCYVKIKFKSFDKLLHPFLIPYTLDTQIESASLLTKFTFLDRDESNFLKSRPINQLITQVNLHQHDIIKKNDDHDHTTEIPINLVNPVKNLYFFTIKKSRLQDFIKAYGYTPNVFNSRYQYMMTTSFSSVGLKINGNYIFDDSYIKLVHENSLINSKSAQSQNDYSSVSEESAYVGNIRRDESGSYSFALYPLDNEPSGHLNFSRIIDQKFVINPEFITAIPVGMTQMLVGDTLEVNIYSTSYNMMVYSGGLCGLKY